MRGGRTRLRDDNRGAALTAALLYPATLLLTLALIPVGYNVSAALAIRAAVANAVTLRSIGVPLGTAQFAALEIVVSSRVIASLEWCEGPADGTPDGGTWHNATPGATPAPPGGTEPCWPKTGDQADGSVIMTARARPVQVTVWAPRVHAVDTAWRYADT